MRTTPEYHNPTTNRSHHQLDRLFEEREKIQQGLDRIDEIATEEMRIKSDEIERKFERFEFRVERELKRLLDAFDRSDEFYDEFYDEIIYVKFKEEILKFDRQEFKRWLHSDRKPFIGLLITALGRGR